MTKELIQSFISQEISPILALHAGGVQIIDFKEDNSLLTLRLFGGCSGCPSSQITLYNGIVPLLEEKFPGIQIDLG